MAMNIIDWYSNPKPATRERYLEYNGTDLVFAMIPSMLDDDKAGRKKMLDRIYAAEDGMKKLYIETRTARSMGNAIGLDHVYIDFIAFDGHASIVAVDAIMKKHGFDAVYRYFDDDRRSLVINVDNGNVIVTVEKSGDDR